MKINCNNSWRKILENEFQKEYFAEIETFIAKQEKLGEEIYPKKEDVFKVFEYTSLEDVKVVILGQDPYHGKNQAHGLSFSVPKTEKIPPSLKNIFKELENDLGIETSKHGFLEEWASQGVFLLNAILTVNAKKPASHKNAHWEKFTDKIIKILSEKRENLVFLLWGNFAKNKSKLIDSKKHLVLYSPHPSPFSAHKGFLGNKHFSKTNQYLSKKRIQKIDWELKIDSIQKELF